MSEQTADWFVVISMKLHQLTEAVWLHLVMFVQIIVCDIYDLM